MGFKKEDVQTKLYALLVEKHRLENDRLSIDARIEYLGTEIHGLMNQMAVIQEYEKKKDQEKLTDCGTKPTMGEEPNGNAHDETKRQATEES